MTKEQVVFWLLLLRFNPDNNVLPNEVIDIAIGAIVAQPERKTGKWLKISPAGIYECSECGQAVMTSDIEAYKYCHGCGLKMEVEDE